MIGYFSFKKKEVFNFADDTTTYSCSLNNKKQLYYLIIYILF